MATNPHSLIAAAAPRASRQPGSRLLPLLLVFACLCAAVGARGQSIAKEYQLKAAFLYNFSKFTQWPAESFATDTSPIVIAVLGPSPFGDELEKVVKARMVDGRAISVRRLDSATALSSAHIVYVAAGAEPLLTASIHGLPGVLTVGETADFADRGGIIRFTLVEEKVRFEIDQGSAEKAGLKISGQLLKLATVIRKTP